MGKSPYPKELRDEVVAIARQNETPVQQIAKDFGIASATLHNWLKAADKTDGATVGATVEDKENRELKRRNRQLEQELEVLRRATAYFSQAVLPK